MSSPSSRDFLFVDSLGFSTQTFLSSVNRDLKNSLPSQYVGSVFLLLALLQWLELPECVVLTVGIFVLFLTVEGKPSVFTITCDINSRFCTCSLRGWRSSLLLWLFWELFYLSQMGCGFCQKSKVFSGSLDRSISLLCPVDVVDPNDRFSISNQPCIPGIIPLSCSVLFFLCMKILDSSDKVLLRHGPQCSLSVPSCLVLVAGALVLLDEHCLRPERCICLFLPSALSVSASCVWMLCGLVRTHSLLLYLF